LLGDELPINSEEESNENTDRKLELPEPEDEL
jgi:hypothetical protein